MTSIMSKTIFILIATIRLSIVMFGTYSWSITECYANNVKTECLPCGQHEPKIVEFGDEIKEIYVSHSMTYKKD